MRLARLSPLNPKLFGGSPQPQWYLMVSSWSLAILIVLYGTAQKRPGPFDLTPYVSTVYVSLRQHIKSSDDRENKIQGQSSRVTV